MGGGALALGLRWVHRLWSQEVTLGPVLESEIEIQVRSGRPAECVPNLIVRHGDGLEIVSPIIFPVRRLMRRARFRLWYRDDIGHVPDVIRDRDLQDVQA